jgi:nitroreductase
VESAIIRHYHVIEKGLAMPEFRARFGADGVRQLSTYLLDWQRCRDVGNCQFQAGLATIEAYRCKHRELGVDIEDILPRSIATKLLTSLQEQSRGSAGVKAVQLPSEADGETFRKVLEARASIRHFAVGRIPERRLIEEAVRVARTTPSVCNRQSGRVHAYAGEQIARLLAHQSGNRGFGHRVPLLLVVTSDLRCFTGSVERYQAWIDGGMFAMTLLLALHSLGLGAVSLNWSVHHDRDQALRGEGGIPDNERIIMLIACGYPAEDAKVPVSLRYPVEHFLTWH